MVFFVFLVFLVCGQMSRMGAYPLTHKPKKPKKPKKPCLTDTVGQPASGCQYGWRAHSVWEIWLFWFFWFFWFVCRWVGCVDSLAGEPVVFLKYGFLVFLVFLVCGQMSRMGAYPLAHKPKKTTRTKKNMFDR